MNLIKIDQKINKSFNSKTTFAFSVLSAISTQITFEKIIEFPIEAFKVMDFNNTRAIIVDKIQKVINIILYRQLINLSVNTSIDFEPVYVQAAQTSIFNSKNYYDCVKSEHRRNNCSKVS